MGALRKGRSIQGRTPTEAFAGGEIGWVLEVYRALEDKMLCKCGASGTEGVESAITRHS
jgi:hypothetical protein